MPSFSWRGRNLRGELISGTLEAAHDGAVADHLLASGVTPVQISAAQGLSLPTQGAWAALRQRPVDTLDLLLLSRQMATLQKAGAKLWFLVCATEGVRMIAAARAHIVEAA